MAKRGDLNRIRWQILWTELALTNPWQPGQQLDWLTARHAELIETHGELRGVHGHRDLQGLTVADLWAAPLPWLYSATVRARRDRLRRVRGTNAAIAEALGDALALFRMRLWGWSPTSAHRRVRLLNVAQLAIRWADDVVDGDAPATSGSPGQFLTHFTRVVEGLADGRPPAKQALAEDLPLIYLVRAADQWFGLPLGPLLLKVWQSYLPDAQRIRDKHPFPSQAEIDAARHANDRLGYTGALVLGLPEEKAHRLAELDPPNATAFGWLHDFEVDAEKRRLSWPPELLAQAPLSTDAILSYAWLPAVPGLADWCASYAETEGAAWKTALAELEREVLPQIKSRAMRTALHRLWRGRTDSWAALQAKWRRLADAPAQSPEAAFDGDVRLPYSSLLDSPPEWRVTMIVALAGIAAAFGITASAQTRERWRRLFACAWIYDRIIGRATDSGKVLELAGSLARGYTPDPADVAGWVSPSAAPAIALLRSSLADIGTGEWVIDLLVRRWASTTRRASAPNIETYTRNIISEAGQLGSAAAFCMSGEDRAQPGFSQFRQCAQSFLAVCALRDSSISFGDEFGKGAVRIRPTARNRRFLRRRFRRSLRHMVLVDPERSDALFTILERTEKRRTEPGGGSADRHCG